MKVIMNDIQNKLKEMIQNNDVVLFMKGTPQAPQCGFSARVVKILDSYQVPFQGIDILADNNIREGVKQYSNWPTLPQLFVKGEFVGGCDIVSELHQTGELKEILAKVK